MKPSAPLALALLLTATAPAPLQAQTPTFTDPANLRGERVRPHDGRELPVDQGASGLQQLLRKLNTRASILNIVAHPDDEDGGMLALYSRGLGARVADISLTRGEGGQNAATGDFEDALGLLRTQELLSSDRYPGVDQFFGTEVDFGFSKTKEESFAKWTHERVLYDVVRAIRIYHPLVLTATFIGGVTDGHGQHQVSGQIAQEAFLAAGDPKVFPELTAEGILPWQPLKVFARVPMQSISDKGLFDYATGQYTAPRFTNYVTGEVTTTTPSSDVIVHEGTQDPLLTHTAANPADINNNAADNSGTPFTYVQFARIGLGLQRSQVGPGVRDAPSGAFDVAYHLYGAKVSATSKPARDASFFDGIDTSIESIASFAPNAPQSLHDGLVKLSAEITNATQQFDVANPQKIGAQLAEALNEDESLISLIQSTPLSDPAAQENILHELRVKRVQLNDAVVLALGVTLDATSTGPDQTVGNSSVILTELRSSSSDLTLGVDSEWIQTASSSLAPPKTLSTLQAENQAHALLNQAAPEVAARPTIPDLTSTHPIIRSLHTSERDSILVTRPYFTRDSIETPVYKLESETLRNAPASLPALVVWAKVNFHGQPIEVGHVVHDDAQPIRFAPRFSVSLSSHAQVVLKDAPTIAITATLTPSTPPHWPVELPVTLDAHRPHPQTLHIGSPGQATFHLSLVPAPTSPVNTRVFATQDGTHYEEGYRTIGYGDLPGTNYFTPSTDRIVPVDLKLPAKHNIAYLPGTGDDVPQDLASIGLAPTILTVDDLTPAKLAPFDTVILGVRTYNAHPDLHGKPTQALFDYARNGGNVLVQYQSMEFAAEDAPYPLSLGSNEKVVDETAMVHLLSTNAPQLNTPNTITPADFNNWIEERGHGFLSEWDSHYTTLTEVHDPGQLPQKGGLITTQLGKGHWTYCAFALYRQLPEAVPGAYRLFLNLLNP